MNDELVEILQKLSSKRVPVRKQAIRELRYYASNGGGNMVRLCLHYISEHDPSYTVRNIARQAFYQIRTVPPDSGGWERAYLFQEE